MKKRLILLLSIFLLVGCGKTNEKDVIKNLTKKINNLDSYALKGSMEIYNEEDTYTYALETIYKKDNLYRVTLINQNNNHEQVILKNTDGVYVVTPSLNKSFKFQSEWPNNSSQAYLLQSLIKDMNNNGKVKKNNNGYVITSKVNYPNNPDLTTEEIYVNKKLEFEKVIVYDNEGKTKIKVIFKDIDLKKKLDKEEFILEKLIDEDCCSTTESGNINDIIYPLYIPTNTYLTLKETIDTEVGNRNILTFTGDNNFTLIEENTSINEEMDIIPVYGEPLFINGSIGAISDNSIYWTSNNIDFYLTSNDLEKNILVTIANSVGNTILVGK